MFPPATPAPAAKTYTVYFYPAHTVQISSTAEPVVDPNGNLVLSGATFARGFWAGVAASSSIPAPAPTPAPTSGGGIFGWLTK